MRILNRRARHDYTLFDRFEAGISLLGSEVKSVLEKKINLDQAFVRIKNGEAWLLNAHIHPYPFASPPAGGFDPRRTRKLLLHKKEVLALENKAKQKRLTIVPVSCYTKRGLVKVEIALAKGRKEYERREEIKKRDQEREAQVELGTQ